MICKDIIVTGDSGTRLHSATLAISKNLLPASDKCMINYLLRTLQDTPCFQQLLGDAGQWELNPDCAAVQFRPDGLAQALLIDLNATLENCQGLKVACSEEIGFRQNWREAGQFEALGLD